MKSTKPPGNERVPYAALLITAVFAIEGAMRSGADLTVVESSVFWGIAITLAPMMQLTSMSDAPPAILFAAIVGVLFVVLAFIETAFLIILRRATPPVRWMVRATA
ncbi:MAG TPA: hypothetical protein VGK84_07850, partial [Candidatus Tumulicola sp.]